MSSARSAEITAAYEYCRQVAKREAKNFYYAFRVLPKAKSDAMCAVYAFMRKADDLADDETYSIEQRRTMMASWTGVWKASRVQASSDPVFVALRDTQERFGISHALLEELVSGTTLDLYETEGDVDILAYQRPDGTTSNVQVYRTFDELYRYCYLVASVVGLVCIRIFGYTDRRAEEHAEKVGIAFQLTNILRDVVEDAERGRVYLPQEDLERSGLTTQTLLADVSGRSPSTGALHVLRLEINRAEEYYRSVRDLLPLLDADSRAAMDVLATIYHELLQRIASNPAAVFQERVSVPTSRKLTILLKGMVRAQLMRSDA